ncbi:transcriptional regulator [Demequina sp. NBRC 110055]|uniref:ArsR/SmtB family transcription factor n=1 Tax=Demequina sp. NBRC 110055 TaxID=1570344 RepID=UPI0009FCDF58|nr:helix-turn-helix domain-containing protein [Demequina sp. NBRC 110055]
MSTADDFPWPVRQITDARELRALAHPVRFALLDLLAEGPLTASQCAERLDQTPANCSYHLRQLAKYGHVRRAAGGIGRERPWEARDEGISWSADANASSAQARAGEALSDAVDEYRFSAWQQYRRRRADEAPEWREADLSTDVVAWMTPDELRAVKEGLHALFAPFVSRDSDAAARPEAARAVRFFGYAYPGAASPERADSPAPSEGDA